MATAVERAQQAQEKIQPFIDDWAERAGSGWAAFRNFAVGQILWDAGLSDEQIEEAVEIDGANDLGIDAWWFDPDEAGSILYLVQAKEGKAKRDDLRKLRSGFDDVMNPKRAYLANQALQSRASELHERITSDSRIRVIMHLLTKTIAPRNIAPSDEPLERGEVRVGDQYLSYEAYVDDVESLAKNLRVSHDENIEAKFTVNRSHYFRLDTAGGVKTVSTALRASELATLYHRNETNLFRLNPRYYLGKNTINKEMAETLESDPENFYLYNNGLTATCYSVGETRKGEEITLTLDDFQIVNGCQTTVTVHSVYQRTQGEATKDVLIPIRIIVASEATGMPDDLVSDLAKRTNRQTGMKPQDFRSGADVHQFLHEQFDRMRPRWYYENKRGLWANHVNGKKARAPYTGGSDSPRVVKMQDLAQACLSFQNKPHIAADRVREYFTDDENHGQLFPDGVNAHQVLLPFLLFLEASKTVRRLTKLSETEPRQNIQQDNSEERKWSLQYIRFPVVASTANVLRYLMGMDGEAYFPVEQSIRLIHSLPDWGERIFDLVSQRVIAHFDKQVESGTAVRSLVRNGGWRTETYTAVKERIDDVLAAEAEAARSVGKDPDDHGLRSILPIVLPSPGG